MVTIWLCIRVWAATWPVGSLTSEGASLLLVVVVVLHRPEIQEGKEHLCAMSADVSVPSGPCMRSCAAT